MITSTSLKHPTCKRAIRIAAFAATCADYKVEYARRADGYGLLRVDARHPGCLMFYRGNDLLTSRVFDAFGWQGFNYMLRLCDALASPTVEKVW